MVLATYLYTRINQVFFGLFHWSQNSFSVCCGWLCKHWLLDADDLQNLIHTKHMMF